MNKLFTHLLFTASFLFISATAYTQNKPTKPTVGQSNKYLNNQVVQVFPKGNINWTMQYVEAKGIGIIDRTLYKKKELAKEMALKAAKADAQKNLFETLKNLNVVAETTIEDVVSNNDETNAKLEALIQNAEMVGKPFETDVREEVTLRIPLYSVTGVAQILLETARDIIDYIQVTDAQQNTPVVKPSPQTNSATGAKSLVFNLNGKKIEPSMFPIIVDQNDDFLFDFTKVYNNYKGEFPIYIQLNQENLASEEFLKTHIVVDMVEYNKGKMVISNKTKKHVNWTDYTQVVGKPGNVLITFY